MRINLGAGDKNLPGYTNVDVAPSRKGTVPDVLCDIASPKLVELFGQGVADEVMAIHVIEHFYFYEIKEVLTLWKSLLKPGGKIVLECPNILYACQQVVKTGKVGADKEGGKMTMWPLYGDPNWGDPLMCHKWGYSPASLIALLQELGFRSVREEPAQFKAKAPRDMRVVGVKP